MWESLTSAAYCSKNDRCQAAYSTCQRMFSKRHCARWCSALHLAMACICQGSFKQLGDGIARGAHAASNPSVPGYIPKNTKSVSNPCLALHALLLLDTCSHARCSFASPHNVLSGLRKYDSKPTRCIAVPKPHYHEVLF